MRGIQSRSSFWVGLVVVVAAAAAACGPSVREPPGGGDDTPCTEGEIRCDGKTATRCTNGEFVNDETCPLECANGLGCVTCQPNTGTCEGNMSHACNSDGSGYTDSLCDSLQGMACNEQTGACDGVCAPQNLGSSYIGCDYFPTVTGNTAGTLFDYAVAIANTTPDTATVTIEGGALASPMTVSVTARSVKVQTLPWVPALKLCNVAATDGCISGNMSTGALAAKGGYRLRSNRPVTVYQFNALQYEKSGQFSYSNDASLLLPTNAWRSEYYAASWQHLLGINPSLMAVTAWKDGTVVEIDSRAATVAGNGAPAFAIGVPQSVTLNAGDVLEITSKTGDFTGTHVRGSKPVQVIAGHYCANVPDGIAACDHMEESIFSVDALGRRYMINAPAMPSLPNGKPHTVRVIATAPNTHLSYDPPIAGAPTLIASAGQFIEIPSTAASFLITSDEKVLVAQYMAGQQAGGNAGDPDMAIAVPVEQFRTSYMFHAPLTYTTNHIDITAPMNANILLNGAPVTGFTPIGGTGLGLRRLQLTNGPAGDGSHTIEGDQKFGITVYGYGQYTSYWYAGGLDLTDIIN